jgi:Leucine-rich repeat (LRR) protein
MLSLKGNQVADLAPLEPLNDLRFLFLEGNKVTDLAPLHRMLKKDMDGPREFAPYLQIYLEGNPLSDASKGLMEEMKKMGLRIDPKN